MQVTFIFHQTGSERKYRHTHTEIYTTHTNIQIYKYTNTKIRKYEYLGGVNWTAWHGRYIISLIRQIQSKLNFKLSHSLGPQVEIWQRFSVSGVYFSAKWYVNFSCSRLEAPLSATSIPVNQRHHRSFSSCSCTPPCSPANATHFLSSAFLVPISYSLSVICDGDVRAAVFFTWHLFRVINFAPAASRLLSNVSGFFFFFFCYFFITFSFRFCFFINQCHRTIIILMSSLSSPASFL